jgi:methionine-rich copper-binding protein CopC
VARLLTAALLLWSGALFVPAGVFAHAEVIDVSPADGSRSEATPDTFSITFNEQVGLEGDAVRIVDSTGQQVDLAPEVVTGTVVSQALPPLADGWYLATWTVTSADGHILNQASTFGVGAASDASRAAALALRSSTAPASWAMRFVADLTLLVAVGAAAAWALMSARSERAQKLRRGSLAIAAIATLAWWAIEAVIGGGAWMHSEAAAFGIARAALLGLAAALAAPHRRRLPALLAVAALVTMVVGGHPGGALITALLLGAHLLAASVWLGAAPALLLMQHDAAVSSDEAHRATKAFSRTATVAIVAIFGGGVLLGAQLTDGFAGGLTLYVALLLAKSGLAGAALMGGALARRRLNTPVTTPAKQRATLRKLFAVDVAILLAVTGLSAALTLGSPHEGHAAKSGVGYCDIQLPSNEVYLTLNPGRVGENLLLLAGAPAATSLSLEFAQPGVSGALLSDLTSRSAGTDGAAWQGSAILPQVGNWRVTLVLRPDRFSEVRGTCIMEIAP